MFNESLYKVIIKIKVGKVDKSVGFGTYKDIKRIKTATANEIVKKKSSKTLGNGIMIIKRIANTKNTTPKSLTPPIFSFKADNFFSSFSSL